ncbi:unnamed protein product [Boreogadus saida]
MLTSEANREFQAKERKYKAQLKRCLSAALAQDLLRKSAKKELNHPCGYDSSLFLQLDVLLPTLTLTFDLVSVSVRLTIT